MKNPTLFVDVDGTLINYNDELNTNLINAIHNYRKFHRISYDADCMMVIWSGGGEWYAERWGSKAFPDTPFIAMAKTKDVYINKEDMAIDDMHLLPFSAQHTCYTPEIFISNWLGFELVIK